MAEDVSIWSEIDESLRADKLQQFWARYSGVVLTICALIVLASAASVFWKNHLRELHEKQTGTLSDAVALAQSGKNDEAIAKFELVEQEGGTLAGIAGLRHAQALLQLKQEDKALALYSAIATGKKDDAAASLRDFAAYQAVIIDNNHGKEDTSVQAVANAGIFGNNLAELNALHALSKGDEKTARSLLEGIVHDSYASFSQRTRAEELLESLKEPGK